MKFHLIYSKFKNRYIFTTHCQPDDFIRFCYSIANIRTSNMRTKYYMYIFFCYLNIKQYGNTLFRLISVWLVSDAMSFELEMWLHTLSTNVSIVECRTKLQFWRFKHKLLALSKFSCYYSRLVYNHTYWFIQDVTEWVQWKWTTQFHFANRLQSI